MAHVVLLGGAAVMAAHGLIHLMGFVAYWPLAQIEELPYKTTLLDGRLAAGEAGMRLFGVLWLVATAGFVLGTGGFVAGAGWWRPVVAGTALLSLGICLLDWEVAFRGAIVDAIILAVLVFASRSAALSALL